MDNCNRFADLLRLTIQVFNMRIGKYRYYSPKTTLLPISGKQHLLSND